MKRPDGTAPLSFAQQRLWFLDRLDAAGWGYHMPAPLRLQGPLYVHALADALEEIVRRHEILRTTFGLREDEPVQTVHPFVHRSLPTVDLSMLSSSTANQEARRLAGHFSRAPFDLARGPLFRRARVRIGAKDHAVLLDLHHIVFDGWSVGVLLRELRELYTSFRVGKPSPLEALSIQYADYAVWQRQHLTGELMEAELTHWRERLRGAPQILELPTDRPRPAIQTPHGGVVAQLLAPERGLQLRSLGRREDTTLFMLMLSAFAVLCSRHAGQRDLLLGTPIANRTLEDTEALIGFFVNTLVLRVSLSDRPSLRTLLRRVREEALVAYAHQDLPFERLVEELVPERDLSRSPLFQAAVSVEGARGARLHLPDLEAGLMAGGKTEAKFDLTLGVNERPGGLRVALSFNRDLFDRVRIQRMLHQLIQILNAGLEDPDRGVFDLPTLMPAERHQLIHEWAGETTQTVAPEVVPLRIRRHAAQRPDAAALAWREGVLTYGELARRASHLARCLRSLGVSTECPVAVLLPRSPEMIISWLAVWEAGGAYLPLDPAYPAERLAAAVQDAGASVLVSRSSLVSSLPELPVHRVLWDRMEPADTVPLAAQSTRGMSEAKAYVIFTSGSTGRPKGVEVSHGALAHLTTWHADAFGLKPGERATQVAGSGFDAAVWETWPYLSRGACLEIVPESVRNHPEALWEDLAVRGITIHFAPTPLAEAMLALGKPSPPALRCLLLGGDRLQAHPPSGLDIEVVNNYGPTEVTVVTTSGRVEATPTASAPSIGRAIRSRHVFVVDREGALVPQGVVGELYVGGAGVARGYSRRPAETASSFVPDPFGEDSGGRLYRTGDLVRFRTDGRLDFLGRTDHQVKIRGFRIELGEIEATLVDHPDVEAAVVLPLGEGSQTILVAFVVTGTTPENLRSFLADRLPESFLPSRFVLRGSLPLTLHGKIDRSKLREEVSESPLGASAEPPVGPVEEILAQLFSQVLDQSLLGRHDDFFALGGHSLLATRLVSRIREALEVEVPLHGLFEDSTVAELARRVEHLRSRDEAPSAPPLAPMPTPERLEKDLPLSFAQQRLWFLDRLEPESRAYHIPFVAPLSSQLSRGPVLGDALREVVRRHEVLRTTFHEDHGKPVQRIHPVPPSTPRIVDLGALEPEDGSREMRVLLAREWERRFHLSHGPLWRAALLRGAPGTCWLAATMHHIVSDGRSVEVLREELTRLGRTFSMGRPSELEELPVQYADYAVWQRRWLQGEILERQVAYWRDQLAGLPPVLELPTDRPRPPVQSYRGRLQELSISAELTDRLHRLAANAGSTPFMALTAGFAVVLSRWAGQPDVALGTPVAGRTRSEVEDLIGFFVNTLVLRVNVRGRPSFRRLLSRVRRTALEAYDHQDVPFERLVEELSVERSLSHAPLFQVMVTFQAKKKGNRESRDAEPLSVERAPARETSTAKFDLLLGLREESEGGGLGGSLEYAADLFDDTTVQRLLRHFRRVLTVAVEDSDAALDPGIWMEPAERHQLLAEVETSVPWSEAPSCTVADLLRAQVRRGEHRECLVTDARRWTYGEIWSRVQSLAQSLRALGVGPEVRVGIALERNVDLVVTLWAVLEAGGAYVPLDPAYPKERLEFLARDAGIGTLVTREGLLPDLGLDVPRLDPVSKVSAAPQAKIRASGPGDPRHLACLIYTSGSTGRPKGVAVEHRSVVELMRWARESFSAEELSGVLASTSINFDLSVFEIFAPLCWGGRVLLADHSLELATLPARDEVRLVNTVPSAMTELIRAGMVPGSVTTVCLAGEPLESTLVGRLHRTGSIQRVENLYGPSEDTTYSTQARVESGMAEPPIGRPLPGTGGWVLDEFLLPVPLGAVGELYLGGVGLARGYLGRPRRTAKSFVPHPFATVPGARLYRTGDLVRWRPDGALRFLGRADHQIKLRGFRIELGEIESALAMESEVGECAVVVREEASVGKSLVAYIVLDGVDDSEKTGFLERLEMRLGTRLPSHMVPAVFVSLDALPRTPNGKIDRRRLKEQAPGKRLEDRQLVAPRTQMEASLLDIWRELLPGREIGVRDNFFTLGGHSLLVVRLVSRIRQQLGHELPITSLFRAPTIEQLAVHLQSPARSRVTESLIVPLRSGEEENRLFWVHPAGGGVLAYLDLAQSLPSGLSLYGLEDPELATGRPGADSIEGMARRHLEELRALFPTGPYNLGGWSVGAVIAFEMAHQLRDAGETAASLTLLDPATPGRGLPTGLRDEQAWIEMFREHLASLAGRRPPSDAEELEAWLRELLGSSSQEGDHATDLLQRHLAAFRRHLVALEGYAPEPLSMDGHVWLAEDGSPEDSQRARTWRRLLGREFGISRIKGDHYSILREPAQELSVRLETVLRRERAAPKGK